MTDMVFVDTETTGIQVKSERILEVACICVRERQVVGEVLHEYVNPEKEVEAGAFRVHGISWEKVKDKPLFAEIAPALIKMLSNKIFVAHNAKFDLGFLNMEFSRAGFNFHIGRDVEVLDTLSLAREIFPGQKNNLDVLCNRLGVDRSHRQFHGALLDTELLVQVYIAMTRKQEGFSLSVSQRQKASKAQDLTFVRQEISSEEEERHKSYMAELQG